MFQIGTAYSDIVWDASSEFLFLFMMTDQQLSNTHKIDANQRRMPWRSSRKTAAAEKRCVRASTCRSSRKTVINVELAYER
jgi:hypothetical protein